MPAEGRSAEPLRCLVGEKEAELQRFCQADVLELRGGRERFRDVAVVEGAAEAGEGRALRGHEQMFAERSRLALRRAAGP